MQGGEICTIQELKIRKDLMDINEWRYFQLRHFIAALPHPLREGDYLTPMERISNMKKTSGNISEHIKF